MRYPLSSTIPIAIFPSGSQPAQTISNLGNEDVYLNDIANNQGYALTSGSVTIWNAQRPLYAYVLAGTVTTIDVVENAGESTLGGITTSGSAVSTNTADLLFDAALAGITTIDVTAYSTLQLAATPIVDIYAFGDTAIGIEWFTSTMQTIGVDSVNIGLQAPLGTRPYEWTIPVRGAIARITTIASRLVVIGLSVVLVERYLSPSDDGTPYIGRTYLDAPGVVLAGATYAIRPALLAGPAQFAFKCSTALPAGSAIRVGFITPGGLSPWEKRYVAPTDINCVVENVVIPQSSVNIRIVNGTAADLTFTSIALTMQG
jgi:hypothetical protein